jgi:ubiquinone biosynthesis monooxygenase Coq7
MSAFVDRCITHFDLALRSVAGVPISHTLCQDTDFPQNPVAVQPAERVLSAKLIRVDHVGEVCAQALYQAQALATSNPELKHHFHAAALEEQQHLNWTAMRLRELGGRPSYLNPLWYGGAFALGLVAGRLGDAVSTGPSPEGPASADVLHALLALGYSEREASVASRAVPQGISVSEGIRLALRQLSR